MGAWGPPLQLASEVGLSPSPMWSALIQRSVRIELSCWTPVGVIELENWWLRGRKNDKKQYTRMVPILFYQFSFYSGRFKKKSGVRNQLN